MTDRNCQCLGQWYSRINLWNKQDWSTPQKLQKTLWSREQHIKSWPILDGPPEKVLN